MYIKPARLHGETVILIRIRCQDLLLHKICSYEDFTCIHVTRHIYRIQFSLYNIREIFIIKYPSEWKIIGLRAFKGQKMQKRARAGR